MKIINRKKFKKILCFFAFVFVLCAVAFVIFINYLGWNHRNLFEHNYPVTGHYLKETYGKYYNKSNIFQGGEVRIIINVDEKFFEQIGYVEDDLDKCFFDEAMSLYNCFLQDCGGNKRALDLIFISYNYNGTYYNFAYQQPMLKTTEIYLWPIS